MKNIISIPPVFIVPGSEKHGIFFYKKNLFCITNKIRYFQRRFY